MSGCKYTDFGLQVKVELLRQGKTQKWLQQSVSQATGLYVDDSYMYKILTGQRHPAKMIAAIQTVLHLTPDVGQLES